jgi:transposase
MSDVEFAELVPHLAGVRAEAVVSEHTWVVVRAAAQSVQSSCPGYGVASLRVHSSYGRRLIDPAIGGRATMIELTVRRFFCDSSACTKRTFAEQIDGLTARHARQTVPARRLLRAVALALGGRAGARLSDWVANEIREYGAGNARWSRSNRWAPRELPSVARRN